MSLKNAFELEETFGSDGKRRKRRVSIGGIFVWGIVVVILSLAGRAIIPPSIWTKLLGN
jgi:hypothetical protein